jgi:hypothetical protein
MGAARVHASGMSRCVCVELQLDLRLWGVVDHSTTRTRAAAQKPAPRGIGGCVRREASIEGVRFRCRAQDASRLYTLARTETYGTGGGD